MRCCGEGGMSPEYFRKHLTYYEASAYIDGVSRKMRAGWEQTRMILSGIGLKNAKTEMPFPWDDDDLDEQCENNEDVVEHIHKIMKERQDKLNKKKNNGKAKR